ncbi:redoxin domain-containing protein [Naumannella sp. ID2617S]|uniref:Peroxiredoxin n=1 Tax=Enemella dayhoffiae TaxID=2016507 RepID=A0A255GN99_9ACTN|nr:redoxin domain-containing protein [Enemella dayhoffiae]NNG21222.1 redoxin domain-containing protein [Naumannella sp. ID2617S]OYO17279.1 peroxiredoxin [Enemella dayhoffiae]
MSVPGIGDRVGVVEATNQFGQGVRLGEGGWSLLFFYPFAFTGICTGELGRLRADRQAYADAGCRIAAISCDTMFSLRVFDDREGFGFDLVADHWPHGAIAERFGVFDAERGCAIRGSFLLDPDGVLRWSVVNPIGEGRDLDAHLAVVRELTSAGGDAPAAG